VTPPTVRGFDPARLGDKDVFNSENEFRCATVLRSSYSKSLCDFAFRCFDGKCSRAGVQIVARGNGHSAFRFTREAEKNNPQIEAARQGWQAAKQVPTQSRRCPTRNSICNMSAWAVPAPLPATPTATLPISASVFHKTFRTQASCA